MRHERQVELLKRVLADQENTPAPLAPASGGNSAMAYTDPERFDRERQRLFREGPAFVGLSCDMPGTGDYLSVDLGGVSVIVMRQRDGSLKGFVNACRHRAAPLLSAQRGAGLRSIACPYHAWTYDLQGNLRGRPGTGPAFDDVAMENCALHGVEVVESHGIVFAQVQGSTPLDANTVLRGAESELMDYGLESYSHFDTRMTEWDCNWKLILDTFTESYHIPWLHRTTIAPYFAHEQMVCDLLGSAPRTIGLKKTVFDEFQKTDETEWRLLPHATVQYFVLPNALVVHQLDHFEVWRVEPVSVGRTRVFTSLYAPEPATDDRTRAYWTRNLDLLVGVTAKEDFPMMEAIHRNLASGAVPDVIYGQLEPGLINLHACLDHMLGEG